MTRTRIAVLALAGPRAFGAPTVAHRVAVAAPNRDRDDRGSSAAAVPSAGESRESATDGVARPGS